MSERMEYQTGLWATIVRELKQLVSRPIYVLCMVGAPLFSCIFLLSLMHEGLPHKIPVAIVDHDHTSTSRNFIQQLGSQESVDVAYKLNSFTEARELMQSGDIFGFLIIPEDFEAKAIAGRQPEISFYTNDAYYIPASLLYKSFKTMSVLASGAVVRQVLLSAGAEESQIMAKLQPIATDMHALGNPWISYSVYLNNSFLPGLLQLMILLVTVFSIGSEMKRATSREWLRTADDSIIIAITGKLIPQTIIFFSMGLLYLSLLYGYLHFPMHNSIWHDFRDVLVGCRFTEFCGNYYVFCAFVKNWVECRWSGGSLVSFYRGIFFPCAGYVFAVPSYLVCVACTALFFDLCRSGIEWNTSLLFACTLCRIDFVCGGIHSVVTPVEKGFDASSICTVM